MHVFSHGSTGDIRGKDKPAPLPTEPPTLDPMVAELRRSHLTSTEIASLFGVGWETRLGLWTRKRDGLDTDPSRRKSGKLGGQVDPLTRGSLMESVVARMVAIDTGFPIYPIEGFWPHPLVDRFGASPEYELIHPVRGPLHLEIKTASYWAYRRWLEARTGMGEGMLKLAYEIQTRVQLMCSPGSTVEPGEPHHGTLVACLMDGDRLEYFPAPEDDELRWFERDPLFEETLAMEADRFWWSVDAGDAPEPDFDADLVAILARQKELSQPGLVMNLYRDPEFNRVLDAYIAARAVETESRAERVRAGNEIRHQAGGAERVIGRNATVSFRDSGMRVKGHRIDRPRGRRR